MLRATSDQKFQIFKNIYLLLIFSEGLFLMIVKIQEEERLEDAATRGLDRPLNYRREEREGDQVKGLRRRI